jgi:hypothetical protein
VTSDQIRRGMVLALDASLAALVNAVPPEGTARPVQLRLDSGVVLEVLAWECHVTRGFIDVSTFNDPGARMPASANFEFTCYYVPDVDVTAAMMAEFDETIGEERVRARLLITSIYVSSVVGNVTTCRISAMATGPVTVSRSHAHVPQSASTAEQATGERRGMRLK